MVFIKPDIYLCLRKGIFFRQKEHPDLVSKLYSQDKEDIWTKTHIFGDTIDQSFEKNFLSFIDFIDQAQEKIPKNGF